MANESNRRLKKNICIKEKCTGCALCKNICPKNCITMKNNEYNEIHPEIDYDKCIDCGLCRKSCPNNSNMFAYPIKCYVSWRKDSNERRDSSSGGFAMLLSEYYIKNSGVVYGVKFEKRKGVIFSRATTFNEIKLFKGSKYAQADIQNVYGKILNDLEDGKKVLFISSPCQVAGVNAFFNINEQRKKLKENLLIVDFLCHGSVPNAYLKEEVIDIEKDINCECDSISFRSNDISKNYYLCLMNKNKIIYKKKAEKQRYFYAFLNSIITKECCLDCKYKRIERIGDISIGDFIGIGKDIYNNFKISNPSLIIINTEKGQNVLQELDGSDIYIQERDIQEAVNGGPSLRGGTKPSKCRKKFRRLYPNNGYVTSVNKSTLRVMYYEWYIKRLVRKLKGKIERLCKFKY